MTLIVLGLVPGILVDAVATAGVIFVLLYLLSITLYLRIRGLSLRSVANLLLLVVLTASLVRSGWRSVYGVVVLLLALAAQFLQRPRGPDA